ncbi:MAG TPA: ACP S-malonyltransferase [Actinomycetota bacterium]|nr:ACP S-malonyltransferase [Actinomycetota bacterium]
MRAAVLFPGQGSQFEGMADPWTTHEAGAAVFERLAATWDRDLVELCRDADALATTELVQPALFACDLAAFRVLEAEGAHFEGAAGHSLGEFVALVAAGVLEDVDAFRVVVTRGRAMQEASNATPSGMTAIIGLSPADAAEICRVAGRGDVLEVANENAAKQVVLSGSIPAIERAEEAARSKGAKAIRLRVAGAFHSPLMRPAQDAVREALSHATFHEPKMLLAPNVSGRVTRESTALRDLLARHVVSSVRWERSMRALAEAGIDSFVEAGPGDVLSKLVRRNVPGTTAVAVGTPEDAAAYANQATEAAPALSQETA